MLAIPVHDPAMRAELRSRPVFVGVRIFFILVGVYSFLELVVDLMRGEGSWTAARDLALPAFATAVILTWLLRRGSNEPAPPTGAT